MKKLFYLLVVALVSLTMQSCGYNSLVNEREAVNASWSDVENQYQRRADLVPNLVSVVKGYATHEESTLTGVIEARAKATQVNISADNLTEENITKYQKAQGELSASLGKLMAVPKGLTS